MSVIAYKLNNSLYLNITNRCNNQCSFCIKNKTRKFHGEFELWLDREPTLEEVIKAVGDPTKYGEIIFCGYGEPLIRLQTVKDVALALKAKGGRIRIDTDGLANLFHQRNILPELQGLVDSIIVSLNAPDAKTYVKLCQPIFGEKAYSAVKDFILEAKKYIPRVSASVVELPNLDIEACRKAAEQLEVELRVRTYYEEKYVE